MLCGTSGKHEKQSQRVDPYLLDHGHVILIVNLFTLSSKFACSVKIELSPLNNFILEAGTEDLSVEGTGETLQRQKECAS